MQAVQALFFYPFIPDKPVLYETTAFVSLISFATHKLTQNALN
jgi:hypothetical protein